MMGEMSAHSILYKHCFNLTFASQFYGFLYLYQIRRADMADVSRQTIKQRCPGLTMHQSSELAGYEVLERVSGQYVMMAIV